MSIQRVLGIALLAAGVIFLVIGMNSSHSMADQIILHSPSAIDPRRARSLGGWRA